MTALATLADLVILAGAIIGVFAAFGAACDLIHLALARLLRGSR